MRKENFFVGEKADLISRLRISDIVAHQGNENNGSVTDDVEGTRGSKDPVLAMVSRVHVTLFTCVPDNDVLEQVRVRHFDDTRG